MVGFGLRLNLAHVLDQVRTDTCRVVVGYFWGAATLGYFNRGIGLVFQPLHQIMGPIGAVVTPALSSIQADSDRYRRFYSRIIEIVAFTWIPIVSCLMLGADSLVMVLLGPKWQDVVPIFVALGPAALMFPFATAAIGWTCVPVGQAERVLRLRVMSAVVGTLAVVLGINWGVVGVATAFSITTAGLVLPGFLYCSKNTPVRLRDLLYPVWRPALASVLALGFAGLLRFEWEPLLILPTHKSWGATLHLIILALTFAPIYIAMFALMPGGRRKLKDLAMILWDLPIPPFVDMRRTAEPGR